MAFLAVLACAASVIGVYAQTMGPAVVHGGTFVDGDFVGDRPLIAGSVPGCGFVALLCGIGAVEARLLQCQFFELLLVFLCEVFFEVWESLRCVVFVFPFVDSAIHDPVFQNNLMTSSIAVQLEMASFLALASAFALQIWSHSSSMGQSGFHAHFSIS